METLNLAHVPALNIRQERLSDVMKRGGLIGRKVAGENLSFAKVAVLPSLHFWLQKGRSMVDGGLCVSEIMEIVSMHTTTVRTVDTE